MLKRISVFFILIALLFSFSILYFNNKNIYADEMSFENTISTSSKSAIMIETNSKEVIYKKNENERLPIASMCKIMTLLLSFEEVDKGNISLDEEIIVSENASKMGGSQIFIENGGSYKISDLIKGIVVASANDACVAMAEKICGSEEQFVSKMNARAKELQMNNTLFSNCTGLPKPTQYSCAKDVSIMFSELIKHKDYFTFSNIWMDEISHQNNRKTSISNTNKLIRFYEGCDCGKTGYTSEAGHCLTASAVKDGLRFISVVINEPDSKTRFKDVSNMFNYGFNNYKNKLVIDSNSKLDIPVIVVDGKKDILEVKAEKDFTLLSKKDSQRNVEINFIPTEEIKAPICVGDIVGKLVVVENGIQIGKVNVLANENIEKLTYFDRIKNIISNWAVI